MTIAQVQEPFMSSELLALSKSVSQVAQRLRHIRLQKVLMVLQKRMAPTRRCKDLEAQLSSHLQRKMQSSLAIDEILTEIESLLDSKK